MSLFFSNSRGPAWRAAPAMAWVAACLVVAAAQFLVVRACGYEVRPLVAYGVYFLFHVYLPGLVACYFLNRGPVSFMASVALGVPTGFAIEILSFLGLAALDGKDGYRAAPVVWMAIAALVYTRRGEGLLRGRITHRHAGLALALAVLVLSTVLATVSNLFAESPLVGGLPQRPIFHDWVYLVSRAAAIKQLWPLEDPSLAGVALQYHYFMLVHVAAASLATGLEVSQVMLRMAVLPLGAVLVAQAFMLGRQLSRRAWGGVLAALLTVAASELGYHPQANESVFLGRFVRWLHVSPTFYFGMIYFGALLLAFAQWRRLPRPDARHLVWLALLATVATGAKGTVVPVVLAALGLWIGCEWMSARRIPWRLLMGGGCAGGMFLVVYFTAMSDWGTGAAKLSPGDIFSVSEFWTQHFAAWKRELSGWLPSAWAAVAAGIACGAVIVVGTLGVRILAFPFLISRHPPGERWLATWLGAAFLVCGTMGVTLKLDADSELYIFLLIRLPSAVLAAAFVTRWARSWAEARSETRVRPAWRKVSAGALAAAIALALVFQLSTTVRRQAPGFRDWKMNARFKVVDEEIRRLQEALMWVRENTEREAVLVSSAFTPANMKKDHWGALDGTLQGVHFYYSALSERRVLVEGPHYLLHPEKVTKRMELTAEVLNRKRPATAEEFGGGAVYLLIDRARGDAPVAPLPLTQRVFANARVDVFRLPSADALTLAAVDVNQ